MGRRLRVEADGGSRGNPGVAGYGALVRDVDTGELLVELAAPLGKASNNVAEYRGMLAGLRAVVTIDPTATVEVAMDSKLVVEQMAGRWKIKHPDMRVLALEGRDLVAEISAAGGTVKFTWMPRADNGPADALSNRGMDGEDVEDWYDDSADDPGSTPGAEPRTVPTSEDRGEPTRAVLVRHCGDQSSPSVGREQAERAAGQVAALVGDAPVRLIASAEAGAQETVSAIADELRVRPQSDADWDEQSVEVTSVWERVVTDGGTVVIVCNRAPILEVLALVLGLPQGRRSRLACAPGSLTAIEAWPDGEAVVAFTNRT